MSPRGVTKDQATGGPMLYIAGHVGHVGCSSSSSSNRPIAEQLRDAAGLRKRNRELTEENRELTDELAAEKQRVAQAEQQEKYTMERLRSLQVKQRSRSYLLNRVYSVEQHDSGATDGEEWV